VSTPTITLRQRRCANHQQREASARCPECGQYYCRECITEHDDRVLCASCLAKIAVKKDVARQKWALVPRLALALFAMAATFLAFLLLGNLLLSIPSPFHSEGGW
jgi:uncharacterized paraquat-inducible protein A